jgi:hypothetical protein
MVVFDAKVFAMVTCMLNESNVFDSPVNEPDTGNLYSPRDGKEMNARILCIRSIGGNKTDKYATKFYIETQNQVTRSENYMDIPAIVSTPKKINKSLEKRVKRATSTSKEEIEKLGSKAEIFAEFEKIKPYLTRTKAAGIPRSAGAVSKTVMCGLLADFRLSAFQRRPGLVLELEASAKEGFVTPQTSYEEREAELSDIFYTFECCAAMDCEEF